jgi:hypothetical protein
MVVGFCLKVTPSFGFSGAMMLIVMPRAELAVGLQFALQTPVESAVSIDV